MAGPRAPLVILLVAFSYAKLINGLPVDMDDVDYTINEQVNNYEDQAIAGDNDEANVSESGIDISSLDHEQESEDSESYSSQGSQSVTKKLNFGGNSYQGGDIVGDGDFTMGGNNYNSGGISMQIGDNVDANVSESGIDMSSLDHEQESEDSESYSSQGSQSVTKGLNFGGNSYQGGDIVGDGDFTMGGNRYNGGGSSMQIGSSLAVSSYGDTVHLTNNDIDETVSGMSSTSSSMFDKRMFVGTFNGKGKSVWSDKPNQIVIIKDSKDCQQMTYKNRVRVSSETLSTSECAKVLDKVKLMEKDVDNLNREMAQMSYNMQQSMAGMFNGNNNNEFSLGNDWPFGPNNNPFAPNNGNTGKNGKPGRKSRRSSRRRVSYQPDFLNNYYN